MVLFLIVTVSKLWTIYIIICRHVHIFSVSCAVSYTPVQACEMSLCSYCVPQLCAVTHNTAIQCSVSVPAVVMLVQMKQGFTLTHMHTHTHIHRETHWRQYNHPFQEILSMGAIQPANVRTMVLKVWSGDMQGILEEDSTGSPAK